PVLAGQVGQPVAYVGRPGLDAGVVRIVAGDERAVRLHAVAAVWPPLGVGLLLRTVLGHAEPAGEVAGLRDPPDQWNREDRAGAGAAVLLDEDVGLRAVRQLRRGRVARD